MLFTLFFLLAPSLAEEPGFALKLDVDGAFDTGDAIVGELDLVVCPGTVQLDRLEIDVGAWPAVGWDAHTYVVSEPAELRDGLAIWGPYEGPHSNSFRRLELELRVDGQPALGEAVGLGGLECNNCAPGRTFGVEAIVMDVEEVPCSEPLPEPAAPVTCVGRDGSGDRDGDGFCALSHRGGIVDCDDSDPDVYPGSGDCPHLPASFHDRDSWSSGCSTTPAPISAVLVLLLIPLLRARHLASQPS